MNQRQVIVFDLNGTLLDRARLGPPLRRIFGRKLSVDEWFTEVLQYSMATTLAGEYRDFGEVATAVLEMSARSEGIQLNDSDRKKVQVAMKKLSPYPDVKASLQRMKDAKLRLAVLTNSGPDGLKGQLRHSGLAKYFEKSLSVDSVRRYKPAPETYRFAAQSLGVLTKDMLMVAAHPWDLLGAARVGCRTAFVTRESKSWYPGAPEPDYMVRDLSELADRVTGTRGSQPSPIRRIATELAVAGVCSVAVSLAGNAMISKLNRLAGERVSEPRGHLHRANQDAGPFHQSALKP